jgi:hypothetical protein
MSLTSFSLQSENKSVSNACATFTPSTNNTFEDITGLSVTITVSGARYVYVGLIPDTASTGPHSIKVRDATAGGTVAYANIKFLRDATEIGRYRDGVLFNGRTEYQQNSPISELYVLDRPTQGTYTYKAQALHNSAGGDGTVTLSNLKLLAIELLF